MSEGYIAEIWQLKEERRKLTSDSGSAIMKRECDLQVAEANKNVHYFK